MRDQHKHIKGYRELSPAEIALMNEVKEQAERTGELVARLEKERGVDLRWTSIAKTQLQQGFMAATRAIAKPTTF